MFTYSVARMPSGNWEVCKQDSNGNFCMSPATFQTKQEADAYARARNEHP